MNPDNIFAGIPGERTDELFETLVQAERFQLERIVSNGQATPPGQWLGQQRREWVILLSGAAGLRFEDEAEVRELRLGDYLLIEAGRRHRVEWTDPDRPSVWLALHY